MKGDNTLSLFNTPGIGTLKRTSPAREKTTFLCLSPGTCLSERKVRMSQTSAFETISRPLGWKTPLMYLLNMCTARAERTSHNTSLQSTNSPVGQKVAGKISDEEYYNMILYQVYDYFRFKTSILGYNYFGVLFNFFEQLHKTEQIILPSMKFRTLKEGFYNLFDFPNIF